uniref:General transcription factor IIH subunit 3 n=1 Tax=Angiostrongylus cantonensis TaxID=6313 RepID=A0A0K0D923_ANGCA
MSTLVLLVEGSACAWGRLALVHGSETINDVIRALISFANAYLSMSASNHLLLFAFANKIKRRFLYNSRQSTVTDASTEMLNALRNTLRDSAQSDDDRVGSPLAAVLSHAICRTFYKRVVHALGLKRTERFPTDDRDSAQLSPTGRVVIAAMTVDFGTEHGEH